MLVFHFSPGEGSQVLVLKPDDIRPTVRVANYFDVPSGRVWGERVIPDLELILIVEGRFAYEAAREDAIPLAAGDVLCIPPSTPHVFGRTDRAGRAVISCIHGELADDGTWAAGDYRLDPSPQVVTHLEADREAHGLFRRCAAVFEGYSRCRAPLLRAVACEIWLRLAERWTSGEDHRLSLRMERMVAYLRAHLCEPVSRRDLAREFSVTPEHVNALFKKELGVSPTQFVHRERAQLAYRYLRDDRLSVKEVAARVGFSDPFYFSKVFKRVMLVPPSDV